MSNAEIIPFPERRLTPPYNPPDTEPQGSAVSVEVFLEKIHDPRFRELLSALPQDAFNADFLHSWQREASRYVDTQQGLELQREIGNNQNALKSATNNLLYQKEYNPVFWYRTLGSLGSLDGAAPYLFMAAEKALNFDSLKAGEMLLDAAELVEDEVFKEKTLALAIEIIEQGSPHNSNDKWTKTQILTYAKLARLALSGETGEAKQLQAKQINFELVIHLVALEKERSNNDIKLGTNSGFEAEARMQAVIQAYLIDTGKYGDFIVKPGFWREDMATHFKTTDTRTGVDVVVQRSNSTKLEVSDKLPIQLKSGREHSETQYDPRIGVVRLGNYAGYDFDIKTAFEKLLGEYRLFRNAGKTQKLVSELELGMQQENIRLAQAINVGLDISEQKSLLKSSLVRHDKLTTKLLRQQKDLKRYEKYLVQAGQGLFRGVAQDAKKAGNLHFYRLCTELASETPTEQTQQVRLSV